MKISTNVIEPNIISANRMKIGQIGFITDEHFETSEIYETRNGDPILKAYDSFVNLRLPSQTWLSRGGFDAKVRLLLPGESITLTME